LAKGTGFGSRIAPPQVIDLTNRRRRGLRLLGVGLVGLFIGLSGCTYNPSLGKWKIDQRTKETYVSYVDPLSSNIRKKTGHDTIEFRKDSIVISGGPKEAVETGIQYRIQELEGQAGTEVRVFQPRKDDSSQFDIDVLRVTPDGKSAHLETPSEIVELKRIEG